MNNKLIIAAAGSGKTKTLIEEALKITNENVLITTFTEANEAGIKKKIINKTGGYIPHNITIQTWFSFLLQHGVKPYQSAMNNYLWDKKISFYLRTGSSSIHRSISGKISSINEKTHFFQYYFISQNNLKMHSDKVSEFTCKCDKRTNGNVIKRITKIYPNIFIDEVQDLAGYDLEILKLFFNSQSNILLVGDPRQGTYSTHNPRKYKKFKKSKIIDFFEESAENDNLIIDKTSLVINYRSNKKICKFSNKLFPKSEATVSGQQKTTNHDGIFLIKEEYIDDYLKEYPKCMQLRWDTRKKVNNAYPVMNYGQSKGLDFDRTLIYPTKPIEHWIRNNNKELTKTSCCKFYVAITRARHSIGIVLNYNDYEDFIEFEKYIPNRISYQN